MFEVELHKFYEVTLPSGINATGKSQIAEYLFPIIKARMVTGLDDPGYAKACDWCSYIYIFPENWNWQYTVGGKGKYVGTFTRRTSKYVKLTFGFDLTEAELSVIGTMARDNCTSEEVVQVDFDAELNWKAGDFGDSYSCYWGSNSMALTLLRHYKAIAVRTWNQDHTKGTGRAWLLLPATHDLGEYIIVLNGCGGKNGSAYDYNSLWFARLLGVFWGIEYHKTYFDGGEVAENLYGSAYVVGSLGDVSKIQSVKLSWKHLPRIYNDDARTENNCYNCGYCSFDEDAFVQNRRGETYCLDCYNEIYAHCYYCDEEVYVDGAASIDGDYYCAYHAEKYLITCYHCGNYDLKNRAVIINDLTLCFDCAKDVEIINTYNNYQGVVNETN